jgi:hypothetical protein
VRGGGVGDVAVVACCCRLEGGRCPEVAVVAHEVAVVAHCRHLDVVVVARGVAV